MPDGITAVFESTRLCLHQLILEQLPLGFALVPLAIFSGAFTLVVGVEDVALLSLQDGVHILRLTLEPRNLLGQEQNVGLLRHLGTLLQACAVYAL